MSKVIGVIKYIFQPVCRVVFFGMVILLIIPVFFFAWVMSVLISWAIE